MLDSDASFFLVPEFQSSRGARRAFGAPLSTLRFDAEAGADLCMSLAPDPGTLGVAAKTDITAAGANAVPTDSDHPDVMAFSTAFTDDRFAIACADGAADSFSLDEDPADPFTPDAAPDDAAASPDARAVTPRRPMRFTFARDSLEHSRQSLPIPNLFENAFDNGALTGLDIDPRLQRSRARARARLAAHEATLPPEARNLWCDDASDDAQPDSTATPGMDAADDQATITLTETAASDGSDGQTPRRAVRHLSVTRRTPKPRIPVAEISDPLQDHLHQVRHALYTPDPEEEAALAAAPPQGKLARLIAALLTVALLLTQIAAHLRATLADQARPLRDALAGNGLRLPSRAIAITGVVFALAQTIPPNLM